MRIVGFEVTQYSIGSGGSLSSDTLHLQEPIYLKKGGKIVDIGDGVKFSYSIKTTNDETTTWANRMDHYYSIGKFDVHMR